VHAAMNNDSTVVVVTICKCSLNPITNPNPIYNHAHTHARWCQKWDWIEQIVRLDSAEGNYIIILNNGTNDGMPAGQDRCQFVFKYNRWEKFHTS
jgi:hypothetical protein